MMQARKKAFWRDPVRTVLTAQIGRGKQLVLCACAAAVLWGVLAVLCKGMQGQMVTALLGAVCLGMLLLGARAALGDESTVLAWLCVALLGALAVCAHVTLLPVKPGRYTNVIAPLLSDMWNYDLTVASAWEEGSWSGVYLFVCALVSRLEHFPQMQALKLFDMLCQFAAAVAVEKLALRRGAKAAGALAGMMACVLAPTMLMNAGIWLHCDATFAMFALWGLVLILSKRPFAGCVLWGLALGTKLQSAFLFALLIPLFMKEKLSLRHLLALAVAYALSQIAFVLDGQGVSALVTRYGMQIEAARESIGLGDRAPGVFGLMLVASVREFSGMGMYFGIATALLVAFALLRAAEPVSDDAWLLAALLLCAGLPLVLPQMNVRMLYLALMLSFACAGTPRRALVALLLEFVSFCGYMGGIFGAEIFPLPVLSLIAIGAAVLVLLELLDALAVKGGSAHA